MKVFLRLESEIPETLKRYGKVRIPPQIVPVLAGRGRRIRLSYGGEVFSLKVDRYGRASLPAAITSQSRQRSKMVIEMSDGEVRLEFL